MMKVLYVHSSGVYGGASKSLIELYNQLKLYSVQGYVLTPRGSASEAFSSAGMKVIETLGLSQFDNTRFGYYRKFRWLILLREVFYLPFSFLSILKLKKLGVDFDIIHINEITLLPVGLIFKLLFSAPVIYHIRSVQRSENVSYISKVTFNILIKYSDAVICIDNTVKKSIPARVKSIVVHNGIAVEYTDKKLMKSKKLTVGMAGVFLRSKGVYEFIEAARILIQDRKYDVKFIIAGENARNTNGILGYLYKKLGFSDDVFADVVKFVEEKKIIKNFEFPGLIKNISILYRKLDVLCFPSHLNACGRPVFEAAFYKVPSIVAIKRPLDDAILNGVTGLIINKPDPQLLASAIEVFIKNPALSCQMGVQAKIWAAKYYLIEVNAKKVLETYKSLRQ
jgi:glycosyltransferase involved in cell wall biosynthesis